MKHEARVFDVQMQMQVFDLRWKKSFISDEKLMVFYLMFLLGIWRFFHLTQMVFIFFFFFFCFLIARIINEFENVK